MNVEINYDLLTDISQELQLKDCYQLSLISSAASKLLFHTKIIEEDDIKYNTVTTIDLIKFRCLVKVDIEQKFTIK